MHLPGRENVETFRNPRDLVGMNNLFQHKWICETDSLFGQHGYGAITQ